MQKDITGKKYGRLTAIHRTGTDKFGNAVWEFECECGKIVERSKANVLSGGTSSCGCVKHEYMIGRFTKHNGSNSRLYKVWGAMRERCNDPNNRSYPDYGGRGIKVCDAWLKDYGTFRAWMLENGYNIHSKRGECTIERLNVNGDYEPSNCVIANMKTQNRNRRDNVLYVYNGAAKTLPEFAEIYSISADALRQRIHKLGWSIESAIETPCPLLSTLTLNGETRSITEWAKILNIKPTTLHRRKNLGWNDERILTTPLLHQNGAAKHE